MKSKIYPRSNGNQTVYLKSVVTHPTIEVGDFTIYNDFVNDPRDVEKNNVLYHYPINNDRLIIGRFCSIACGVKFIFNYANHTLNCPPTHSIWSLKNGMCRNPMTDLRYSRGLTSWLRHVVSSAGVHDSRLASPVCEQVSDA